MSLRLNQKPPEILLQQKKETEPPPKPGRFTRLRDTATHAFWSAQSATTGAISASAKHTTAAAAAAAVSGAVNKMAEHWETNERAITEKASTVVYKVFLQPPLKKFHQLLDQIQVLLEDRTEAQKNATQRLAQSISTEEIQAIFPDITKEEIDLIHLEDLDGVGAEEVVMQAKALLQKILPLHEGLIPQLRTQLNQQAPSILRDCRDAMQEYQSDPDRSCQHLTNIYNSLRILLNQRELAPKISENDWTLLDRFFEQIEDCIECQDSITIDDPLEILNNAVIAHQGIIEEAGDIFLKVLDRALKKMIPAPGQIIDNLFSRAPAFVSLGQEPLTRPAKMPEPQASPSRTRNIFDMHTLMDKGSGLLNYLMSSTCDAISSQVATALATLMRYSFEKIREHILIDGKHPHLVDRINRQLLTLKNPQKSSWEELRGVLKEAFDFLQEQQIYIQGMRLPLNPVRPYTSAIPGFYQMIRDHQTVLKTPKPRSIDRAATPEMLKQQIHGLQSRYSSFGAAQCIATLFGLKINKEEYAKIYAPSLTASKKSLHVNFKLSFFKKINQSHLNIVMKWIAKKGYKLLISITTFYINSISNKIITYIENWAKDTPIHQNAREELFIKNLCNWLAITSGAYNEVAKTHPLHSKSLDLMMDDAIMNKKRNAGLTTSELHSSVAKAALDAFGPQIQWDETIENYFNSQIPKTSPATFFNQIVVGMRRFLSFFFKIIIFIPQWIGNKLIQRVAKTILDRYPVLLNSSENTVNSLHNNTPASYAMQQFIHAKTKRILELLEESLRDGPENCSSPLTQNTNKKNLEVQTLIISLLEVINKGQWHTKDQLERYLDGRSSLLQRIEKEAEDSALPEVIEDVSKIILAALKTMTQPNEVRQMLYEALVIGNNTFEDAPPIALEEFVALQRQTKELTDQLLQKALFHAIGEKFDFTQEKQKKGIYHFIQTIKEQTQIITTQIGENLSFPNQNSNAFIKKISATIQSLIAYERARIEAQNQADSHRNFHTETKLRFNALSLKLIEQCQPLAIALNETKERADRILNKENIIKYLIKILLLSKCADNRSLSSENCSSHLNNDTKELIKIIHQIVINIEVMQNSKKSLETLVSVFKNLQKEKIATFGKRPSSTPQRNKRQVSLKIDSLTKEKDKIALKKHLKTLIQASNQEEVDAASTCFLGICKRINESNEEETELLQVDLDRAHENIQEQLNQSIENCNQELSLEQENIQRAFQEISKQADELNEWVESQEELPIWNFFPIDMTWVCDNIKNLAFNGAQAKVQQLSNLLSKRHNYRGFINQTILLPFLKEFGKPYLKNTTPS